MTEAQLPKIKHFATLGEMKFSPPNGRGESGYAEIQFQIGDRDNLAEVLAVLPQLQEGDVKVVLAAGRAGRYTGIGRLRAARLVPPKEAGQASVLAFKVRFNESLEKIEKLASLRIQASALELENVTLEMELQAPPLPLEGGEDEDERQQHLMDDPPPAGGREGRGKKPRA